MSNKVRVTGWKWEKKKKSKSNNIRKKKDREKGQLAKASKRDPKFVPQIRKPKEQTETKNKGRIQDSFPKIKGSLMLNTPSAKKH